MTQPEDDAMGSPFDGMSLQEQIAHKLEANATHLRAMASGEFKLVRASLVALADDLMQDAKALRQE